MESVCEKTVLIEIDENMERWVTSFQLVPKGECLILANGYYRVVLA
jgi:hypothetical protein